MKYNNHKNPKNVEITRVNFCETFTLDRSIATMCRDSFRPSYEIHDPKFAFKGTGVYRSIVKLFYEKCKDYIDMPKVNFNKIELGDVLRLATFPSIREIYKYHNYLPTEIPKIFSPILRKAKSVSDIVKAIYTKKYKKGYEYLLRAIETEESRSDFWSRVTLHYTLRGLLPFEYIVDITEKNPHMGLNFSYPQPSKEYMKYRKFFKSFTANQLHKFLLEGTLQELWDTMSMIEQYKERIPIPKIYNLHELHEFYSKELDKLRHKDFPLMNPPIAKEIDNIHLDGMVLVIPKTSHELLSWGRQMNNCIGSYGMRVGERGRLLIGVTREGKLVYNIEVYGGEIHQFYAPHNTQPPQKDYEMIEKLLMEKKVIKYH
jgi:hypothetical protein